MHDRCRYFRTPRGYLSLLIIALAFGQGCNSDTSSKDTPLTDASSAFDIVDNPDSKTPRNPDTDISAESDAQSGEDAHAEDTGPESCPLYQTRCDGTCIPTVVDPNNCGGCGVTCGDDEVCSGGTCTDTCMPGLNICDRACVDFATSNAHCGGCGNSCAAGTGCVEGSCLPAANLDTREDACAGGGPAIDLGDTVSVERQCTGELAERTFRWAVCSCDSIRSTGQIFADAYDSSTGPYIRGGEGGGLATNGIIDTTSGFITTGTLWAADTSGHGAAVQTTTGATIGQRLYTGSNVHLGRGTRVGGDAFVDGNVRRNLTIGGTLTVPASATVDADTTYANLQRAEVNVAPPCDACDVADRIPVANIVASRSGTNNDNALIGLDENVFSLFGGNTKRIDLPCGNYYLSEITGNQGVTIVAHGNTALYIGGDILSNGKVTITLTPDAQLDLFVAGSVRVTNGFKLGSPNYPALVRAYIGGDQGLQTTSGSDIAGFIYAVPGGIQSTTSSEFFGGVYGQTVGSTGGNKYHYDRLINVVGESCPDRTPGVDPQPDPNICATATDACESDADCCSPLLCGEAGECVLLDCQPSNAACTSNDDCCSGGCGNNGFCITG
ncbi:DUF7305 domain-containing protein [Bradymonas sediminis]|nr:hypothetical protein [Bradymonas sediminis]TDP75949.1 stigma-specific protein Stig1 [Bradymonas sediminis]